MSMGFSLGQSQKQEQKQILTQRLIQSMELLQLPLLQLEERIEIELETNPVLEAIDDISRSGGVSEANEMEEAYIDSQESESRKATDDEAEFRLVEDFAETYAGTIDEAPIRSQNWLEEAAERHRDLISNIPSHGETLEEYLRSQLAWFDMTDAQRKACEVIIGNIDRNGLLTTPLEELRSTETGPGINARPGNNPMIAPEDWAQALKTVQSMDPPGIGACSVPEALLHQVSDETTDAPLVRQLIERHFDDILHNRIPLIIKETGYPKDRIEKGIEEIQKLNPYPGREFDESTSPAVLPDLYAFRDEKGEWDVDINDGNQIRLGINSKYRAMLKEKETDRGTKKYLRRNIAHAQWFIEALRQRKLTLLRVGRAIVRHQSDFFELGPENLRPLRMQRIADELGIHIATVSRACDGKWLQAPRGVYPLKSFFSGAVKTEGSADELTSSAVKSRMKAMIDREEKKSPLSDEEIAAQLKTDGINISRRTVAKYRDALNIPSSRRRKEWS
ncbi:MAG: RNA polymerase factor sigma-54 [Thermoguttaceae bacterium]|jgi:RNA polymerase sigma-54 factor